MIELKDIAYARLGTPDIAGATRYATEILGLQVEEQTHDFAQFRSDRRGQTLTYFEGDPADQTVAFEIDSEAQLDAAAAALEAFEHRVVRGNAAECEQRKVQAFIGFTDPSGNRIELAVRPGIVSRPFRATRDIDITGFSHIGLFTRDAARDEAFWTEVCNARVSDRIADVALLRINPIHHTIALAPADRNGIHHINYQVATNDDVLRAYYFLAEKRVPIVFGPGRHPTSGARFLYFRGPDNLVFEYSCGVDAIDDEDMHQARTFLREPESICMWGSVWNEDGWLSARAGI